LWGDPGTTDPLDTSQSLFELDLPEEDEEADPLTEAARPESDESTLWDLEGTGADLEQEQPVEKQREEPPLPPSDPVDVGPSGVENAGFRTLALQELRDLAGTAPVQSAPGPRQTHSMKPSAETSDEKPPAQPKVRALRRIIAAVRGL
ncbi:MAG: hypothetical protein M3454_07740, partial [Actinomycetota bacterium]|nr:hypothetical protein [Actinomycetota bacterium]